MEDLAVSLRDLAEADGWEAVVDGSLGPEVSKAGPQGKLQKHAVCLGLRTYSY